MKETENEFVLTVDLPGLDKKDVKVGVEDGTLTISGERRFERDEKKDSYHFVERRYGRFHRGFDLGDRVNAEDISAKMDKGVLEIRLGKKEEAKPKTIEVKVH
ncbi:MAG: Hsp20/alpha crystallin family protein [Deltaproteobacteria bacterium]|nr:Hsp20/alpha crystallin family protein [Deltaproteobacteria bacterium]